MTSRVLLIPVLAVYFSLVTFLVFDTLRRDELQPTVVSSAELSGVQSRLANLETSIEALLASLQEHRTELDRALARTGGSPVPATAGIGAPGTTSGSLEADVRSGTVAAQSHPGAHPHTHAWTQSLWLDLRLRFDPPLVARLSPYRPRSSTRSLQAHAWTPGAAVPSSLDARQERAMDRIECGGAK